MLPTQLPQQRLIQALTLPVIIKTEIVEIRETMEAYLLQINYHLLHPSLLPRDQPNLNTYQKIVKFNQ